MLLDLLQSSQLHRESERTGTLERRVAYLERELGRTNAMLEEVVKYLERQGGRDLDGDGQVG